MALGKSLSLSLTYFQAIKTNTLLQVPSRKGGKDINKKSANIASY